MRVYSFPRGGLSFHDPAAPFADSGMVAFLPALSVIPLVQYPGEEVTPVVSPGDIVSEGMLVGRGEGLYSANVHATVPGKVIRLVEWKGQDGQDNKALVIRMEGSFDLLGKEAAKANRDVLNHFALTEALNECGIVEMEGVGRPVAGILKDFRRTGGERTLVVRCVFDDPWLVADYVLLKERLSAVIEGSFIIARSDTGIRRIVFAVSHKEKKLGRDLLAAAVSVAETSRHRIPLSFVLTGSKYPQRNDRELEIALRNYEKKEGLELGKLLILGPATLAAVFDAAVYRRPILERYIAVGGSAVRNPQFMRVRIGKRIGDLFEECGGFSDIPARIATGSPVWGKAVSELDEPVTKTSYAVFAMLKSQAGNFPERGCISCGECRNVCPVGLDPEELYKEKAAGFAFSSSGKCHGCGCCEVVCPSHLPLADVITGHTGGRDV